MDDNIIKICPEPQTSPNNLLNELIKTLDNHGQGLDYFAIIGIIEFLKDYIKEEMEE